MRYLLILCLPLMIACGDSTAMPAEDAMEEPTSSQDAPSKAGPEGAAQPAWSLEVRENWVEKTEIITMESAPPQFAVKFTVTMPTPGWELKVDETSKPDSQGRIIVKVTGTPPEGIVAQVLQSETFQATLGSLNEGNYLVELHYRRKGEQTHQRKGTAMLQAGGQ